MRSEQRGEGERHLIILQNKPKIITSLEQLYERQLIEAIELEQQLQELIKLAENNTQKN